MSEGGMTTRMKRNGARLFKNPPQPHMCIQDFIKGTTAPCYVNVLSWDRIGMPCRPAQTVPLYGGMRVPPPRTKAEAVVFAVMANPEVLRVSGKNAQDPKKRSTLIELLLDFVETMNAGVVFSRRYTILKDRDITGELKEVWNAVQASRDLPLLIQQPETWIDAQPPVPQYPQFHDQQQQQQQQQQEYVPQPPQYHSTYNRNMSNEQMHYNGYIHQPQTPLIGQNEQQMYQSGQLVAQQYHHGNLPRVGQERYNYRDRGRENLVQNVPQQNCPAYPAPQYQFQQLPRQMVPQYVNSNMLPNANLNYATPNTNPGMNANLAAPFQPYIAYQQRMDNAMHMDIRRMQQQQQQQQQQIHMNHVQPVLPQYDPSSPFNVQPSSSMNILRLGRPHMGVAQKNNTSKRQTNSPTHTKAQASCSTSSQVASKDASEKPKSPVKVLQRELPSTESRDSNHSVLDNGKTFVEKSEEFKSARTRDFEDGTKGKGTSSSIDAESKEQNDSQVDNGLSNNSNDESCDKKLHDAETNLEEHAILTTTTTNIRCANEQRNAKTRVIAMKSAGRGKHKESAESNRTTNRSRFANDSNQPKTESPRRSQTTMNSIIKNVFKIHPGGDEAGSSVKRKSNGQTRSNAKVNENEDSQQGYTILKKTDSTSQDEVTNEIAQMSVQDCKDATELGPVLS